MVATGPEHKGVKTNTSDILGYEDPVEDIPCMSMVADLATTATDGVKGAEL